jgi:hypothetical protein
MTPESTPSTCSSPKSPCQGHCPGYGTRSSCPPLIVLAVLSTSPGSQDRDDTTTPYLN